MSRDRLSFTGPLVVVLLAVLVTGCGQRSQSTAGAAPGGINYDTEMVRLVNACVSFFEGEPNSLSTLTQHGFGVKREGNDWKAWQYDPNSPGRNRRNLVTTHGEAPGVFNDEPLCVLSAGNYGPKTEADKLFRMVQTLFVAKGYAPRKDTGPLGKFWSGEKLVLTKGTQEVHVTGTYSPSGGGLQINAMLQS